MRSLSERRWASSSAFPTIYHHITHQNNSLGIFTHLCTWESYHVVVSTGSCCADEVLGYDTIRTYVWCQLSTLTKEHSGRRQGRGGYRAGAYGEHCVAHKKFKAVST